LAELFPDNEMLAALGEIRKVEKLHSTYVKAFLAGHQNGYIYTCFNPNGTNTGRWSSDSFNFQNIPQRGPWSKEILTGFIVPDEYEFFFMSDYAALEARMAAICSGDPLIIQMINSGVDFHAYAASIWFGKPMEEITSEERNWMKMGNFGVLYGLTERGAPRQLGLSVADGARFVQTLKKEIFPGLGEFIDGSQKHALENGYVEYLDSLQVRRFPMITPETIDAVLKHAVNSPLPGRGSNFNIEAAIMAEEAGHTGIRLPIHDALGGYAKSKDEAFEIAKFQEVRKYAVPLICEVKLGTNWGNLKVVTA